MGTIRLLLGFINGKFHKFVEANSVTKAEIFRQPYGEKLDADSLRIRIFDKKFGFKSFPNFLGEKLSDRSLKIYIF